VEDLLQTEREAKAKVSFPQRRSKLVRLFDRRRFILAAGVAMSIGPSTITARAESPSVGNIFIGELEKRIISDYYQRHLVAFEQSPEGRDYKKHKNKHKGLPPGLAKKGTLPPGIAKQLARNGQLPPGLDYHPLPQDLIVQLPPVQPGYRYTIVDDKVLLVQAASNLILDVLEVAALEILK
jgi:hypothetical protein